MKNVSLIKLPNKTRRLIGQDSTTIDAYTQFFGYMNTKLDLAKGTKTNYGDYVADFIDYLIEAGVFLCDVAPTTKALDNAVNSYPDFLANGYNSDDPFVNGIAKALDKSGLKDSTCQIAAINHFLSYSVQLAKDMKELAELETGQIIDSPSLIFSALDGEVAISRNEIRRIKQNSILGANLRQIKGTRKARLKARSKRQKGAVIQQGKDFPFERFEELLINEPCPRNRTLWALLGGGGLRQHEGLSVNLALVDTENQIVRVEDPNDLRGASKYSPNEKLRWKGRETAHVYVIPAIRKIFFDSYLELLRIRPISDLPFVFLKHDRDSYGNPLLEATYSTLNKAFKKAQKRIGMKKLYTLHSLRHLYGVFMRNYFPTPWKTLPGLPADEVQKLMGHSSADSTKKYARVVDELMSAKLELAERSLMGETNQSLPSVIANNLRKLADNIEGKK